MSNRADSRPRAVYSLPDGEVVTIVRDQGEYAPNFVSFQLKSGDVVSARYVSGDRYVRGLGAQQ